MHLLYQTATFSLSHDPINNWLYAHWSGITSADAGKAGCEMILTHVRHLKCTKLLNDGLADEDGWTSLATWVADSFIQALAQEGVVAIAWVQPTNSFALHTAKQVLHRVELLQIKPLIDVFTDTESAYAWLKQWPENGEWPYS